MWAPARAPTRQRVGREKASAELDHRKKDVSHPDRGDHDAERLAEQQFSRRSGVVSRGSRVPCSRSPTTEYAAITAGSNAGATSSSRNVELTACRPQRTNGRTDPEDDDQGLDQKDERQHRHGSDDERAAPIFTKLLAEYRGHAATLNFIARLPQDRH